MWWFVVRVVIRRVESIEMRSKVERVERGLESREKEEEKMNEL